MPDEEVRLLFDRSRLGGRYRVELDLALRKCAKDTRCGNAGSFESYIVPMAEFFDAYGGRSSGSAGFFAGHVLSYLHFSKRSAVRHSRCDGEKSRKGIGQIASSRLMW